MLDERDPHPAGVPADDLERYEPLPGILQLPGWLRRRTSRPLRVALATVALLVGAVTVVAAQQLVDARGERDEAARRERAEAQAERVRRLQAEIRPRTARSGAVDRAECERFPRTVGARPLAEDPSLRRARLQCVAVTAELARGTASIGGVIGHPYRAVVDFGTGRYTFCKTTGVTGPERDPLVRVPRACGGR